MRREGLRLKAMYSAGVPRASRVNSVIFINFVASGSESGSALPMRIRIRESHSNTDPGETIWCGSEFVKLVGAFHINRSLKILIPGKPKRSPEKGKTLWKRRRLFMSLGRYKNPFLPNLSITPAWIQIRTRSVVSKDLDPDPDLDSAKRLDPHPDTDGLHSKNFFPLIQRPEANAYLICSPH